ncbi:MAG: cytochrome c [Chloroflexi bacterium]|nr:cytochrome c [Chloroflexota bacterium]
MQPPTAAPTPTPTLDDVFLAGAEIFQTHCVQCHGPHGMGDGPAATTLPVQPAILPFHIPLHRDEDVYVFISEGFPNLGMPAFREILSQEEILQVLRYLRVRFGGVSP